MASNLKPVSKNINQKVILMMNNKLCKISKKTNPLTSNKGSGKYFLLIS